MPANGTTAVKTGKRPFGVLGPPKGFCALMGPTNPGQPPLLEWTDPVEGEQPTVLGGHQQ